MNPEPPAKDYEKKNSNSTAGKGAEIANTTWQLGHSNISTTELYDKCTAQPKDSPTFKVECWLNL